MSDIMTAEQRHRCMSHIRSEDTAPEMIVRRALHAAGFRYRLHVHRLPGSPDIVLKKYSTAIMVNGCFWHGHEGCSLASIPETNNEFWLKKIRRNQERDKVSLQLLEARGWRVITVWECTLKPTSRQATFEGVMEEIRSNGEEASHKRALRRFRTAVHRASLKARTSQQ